MAHRSWQLNGNDDVQDDVEDAAIRRLAAADEASDSHDLTSGFPDDSSEDTEISDALREEPA
jgi:multicomponent Na+:H+ antiporter subunit C